MISARVLWACETATSGPVRMAGALMLVNAPLLTAHVLHRSGFVLDLDGRWFRLFHTGALWNGGIDGSLMELLGLLQLRTGAVLFRLSLRQSAHWVLAAWGVVFLLLIADDLFRIHERVGAVRPSLFDGP